MTVPWETFFRSPCGCVMAITGELIGRPFGSQPEKKAPDGAALLSFTRRESAPALLKMNCAPVVSCVKFGTEREPHVAASKNHNVLRVEATVCICAGVLSGVLSLSKQ